MGHTTLEKLKLNNLFKMRITIFFFFFFDTNIKQLFLEAPFCIMSSGC